MTGDFFSTLKFPPIQADTPAPNRKQELEKQRVNARLEGFDPKSSVIGAAMTKQFGSNLTHSELVTIAGALANKAGISLDRDAKRRKTVLLKWFEEHSAELMPFLHLIVLEEANT
jgi:hypothetical protein